MGHSCRTLLWGTLIGHSCGTLLRDTLVRHSCGTRLRDTLVEHSCGTLLWDTRVATRSASMVRGWVPRRDGHDGVDADADVTLTWLKANDWRRRRDVTLT